MQRLVLGSFEKKELGEIHVGIYDQFGDKLLNQKVRIIAQSTKKAWLKTISSLGARQLIGVPKYTYFYCVEVQRD